MKKYQIAVGPIDGFIENTTYSQGSNALDALENSLESGMINLKPEIIYMAIVLNTVTGFSYKFELGSQVAFS